ncbi:MAG: flagellar basal body rod protein FlgC [Limnochordaceae bacterium]|nr:flagellar basal body rod protein FlgC [Limnochordaceae bacterium]
MAFLSGLDISASGLTAERLRMDLVANNLANAYSTRSARGGVYRRQVPVFAAREGTSLGLWNRMGPSAFSGQGVEVVAIAEDPAPPRLVYDPGHPDARPDGYVEYPNVDVVTEMVDMMAASRAYQANLAAFTTSRDMAQWAVDLIRV